ncbi:MAG TPA: alpha/beta hydrolase [Actinocrinis sp.]|nr:alpha/beta hydrolase [Actinocrinis sp.]
MALQTDSQEEGGGTAAEYDVEYGTSADGTRVGWRRFGTGPALVLLHGSNESAASHTALGRALADAFTVILPDRRGRGLSGPYPADYGVGHEVDDLDAVLKATGARLVFGVSASGLVALEAARRMPDRIDKLAVYEPALLLEDTPVGTGWVARFDAEMARGKAGAALVTSMIGLRLGPPVLKAFPRGLLAWLTEKIMSAQDRAAAPHVPTMRALAPTIRFEGVLLGQMRGTLETFSTLPVPVLLMGGSKGLSWLKPTMEALEKTLPDVRRVEFAGLDHGGSADVSKANPKGDPAVVAAAMREFFTS